MKALIFLAIGFFLLTSCGDSRRANSALFILVKEEHSGISFANTLDYTEDLNPYTYKNFFNGGGVGIGDINGDSLPDIFFSGNLVSNRLYLNKGNFRFEDITKEAGLESRDVWSTGVSMVDLNADGLLDIYICKSGPPGGPNRYNELFINNGDLTFREEAANYGLDNTGLSSHAAFFDYDRDGDLDCYLLNNSIKSVGGYDLIKDQRLIPDTLGGNKLLRNDDGRFVDVTQKSGIYSSDIGFGLGITIGDINNDNWPDIFISNDFFEKDYLYINQQDGTFHEELESHIREISMGSMGADLADINNDGHSEIFVTEMLPERRDRLVSKAIFESWDKYQLAKSKGYYNQFGRNVLQLNHGDGTFGEIGRFAGVEATDWSWGALIFDMDNDGLKDIFVANGIAKDLLDLDYINFMSNPENVRKMIQTNKEAIKSVIDMMPSEPLSNYAFQNKGNLTFNNMSSAWGFSTPTFSNGSAYGDLDNDGDLDLVVNNINMPSFVFENTTNASDNSWLSIRLKGNDQNGYAIGTKAYAYIGDQVIFQELNPFRGFMSSTDYKLVLGLGKSILIDSLVVVWPSDRVTYLYDILPNQEIQLEEKMATKELPLPARNKEDLFVGKYTNPTLAFSHQENVYADFDKDRLLYHMSSTEGPCLCTGDINGDNLDDFYVGGAMGQAGQLFIQNLEGGFTSDSNQFVSDREAEDLDCAFFDANGNGTPDLYVTSGSSEFGSFSTSLNDRLYFGDGLGGFTKSPQRLPNKGIESTSVVIPLDIDRDGDSDLFVGGRSRPFYYGVPTDSYLLINDGTGVYSLAEGDQSQPFQSLGMVTDATLADLDADGTEELIVVGQWMPVKVFAFKSGKVQDVSRDWLKSNTNGWYNTIKAGDVNGDGTPDLIVGNHGLNSRFRASESEPIELIVGDLDQNGTFEHLISVYSDGEQYPFVQLKELTMQLPGVKKQYLKFGDYKDARTMEIFDKDALENARTYQTFNLASGVFINSGNKLAFEKLTMEAQMAPVFDIYTDDFNGDGRVDFILGGNFAESKPEVGIYQAGRGALYMGSETGPQLKKDSGLILDGNVRRIQKIKIGNRSILLVAQNNQPLLTFVINEK